MAVVRIHGAGGVLTFDLREILAALGSEARSAWWSVGNVAVRGGEFDASGDGAVALKALVASGERIAGSRLAEIAESTQQVVWGEFRGYDSKDADSPRFVVTAFDSSWWEVGSEILELIDKVAESFDGVEHR
jgi:hypothetical protein